MEYHHSQRSKQKEMVKKMREINEEVDCMGTRKICVNESR